MNSTLLPKLTGSFLANLEMAAAYAALISLLNTIHHITNHPRISRSLRNKKIESLRQKAESLLDFIEKYSYHGGSEEADDLERRIASAAYEAEDAIDFHIVDQFAVGKSATFLPDLQRIMDDMDSIKERVIQVKVKRGFKDPQPTYSSVPVTSPRPQTRMVGFDEELTQIRDILTREERSRQVISVTGMGGAGKSTLVRNVFDNSLIVQHFDVRAWTTISQQYSVEKILTEILSSIEKATSQTVEKLGEQLRKSLWGRRYLIVLDDIWSVEVWDEIRFFFPDNNNGSRIILTTRLSNLANQCSSVNLKMRFLDGGNSWRLLCETVFGCEDCPPKLEMVGKEISELCKGLPLSLVVIGGLLRMSDMRVEYWRNIAKDMNSILDENDYCYRILSLSYSQLAVHLKPCFLCMGFFREDSEIRASRIIQIWVAEGFIKPNGGQVLEEIAEGYLNDLVDRNLILVGKHRFNGKVRSCHIHDLIRDVCMRLYEKEKLFCAGRALGTNRERRIVYHGSMPNRLSSAIFLESAQFVRSFVGTSLNYSESSLEAILQNVNLRFLSYQPLGHPMLKLLIPSSISLIWNLQTLAIHGIIMELFVAPVEIWNMPQLRHVECDNIYLPNPLPNDDLVVLENLRTLTKAVNLKLSEEVCKRIPNINKLHVTYDESLVGYDDCLFDHLHNLRSLHKLQSLKLVAAPYHCPPSHANWIDCKFPTSLHKLSLKNGRLDWCFIDIIGSLPQLEVLELENSGVGDNWEPVCGQFLSLKSLTISRCSLRCWAADDSHFPVLKKLNLVGLLHLEEIPSGIGDIPTLQLISVEGCSEAAENSAMKIKDEQESLGNDWLQVRSLAGMSTLREKARAAVPDL